LRTAPFARDALGIGLRRPHHEALLQGPPGLHYLELIAEDHLEPGSLPRDRLHAVSARFPLVGHGVSLNLLGAEPLDAAHLGRVRALLDAHAMPWFSDHLCWTRSAGVQHHDLLPAPHEPDLVPYAAARARHVQEALGVPFGIENLSSYLTWRQDRMPEWEFYREVVRQSGCWFMLDLNNVVVSAHNHGFDPRTYLEAIDWDRVLQVHLAGHRVRPDGLRHDTHDRPVDAEVWALYRDAWTLGGPFPTLLEWDADIPPLDRVLDELSLSLRWRTG
jgi:uncharacterized protein